MSSHVKKNNHPIDKNTRCLISTRYKRITKAINLEFWNSTLQKSLIVDMWDPMVVGQQ